MQSLLGSLKRRAILCGLWAIYPAIAFVLIFGFVQCRAYMEASQKEAIREYEEQKTQELVDKVEELRRRKERGY